MRVTDTSLRFDDSQVQEDSKMYPFKLTDLNGSVGISVFDGQQKQERVFAPQEISSYVLGKVPSLYFTTTHTLPLLHS